MKEARSYCSNTAIVFLEAFGINLSSPRHIDTLAWLNLQLLKKLAGYHILSSGSCSSPSITLLLHVGPQLLFHKLGFHSVQWSMKKPAPPHQAVFHKVNATQVGSYVLPINTNSCPFEVHTLVPWVKTCALFTKSAQFKNG